MGKKTQRPAEILTRDELAIYLRVAQDALQPLIDSGQIPGRQIEGEWRFLRAAVDDWLRAPAVPAAPAAGLTRDLPADQGAEGALRDIPAAPPLEFMPADPSNFAPGRGGQPIVAITNHVMIGELAGTIDWFGSPARPNDKKNPKPAVSSNYGIGRDGRVVQFVRDRDTAYANGPIRNPNTAVIPWIADAQAHNINPNSLTISIEWAGFHKGGSSGSVDWLNPKTGHTEKVPVDFMKGTITQFWQPSEVQYQAGLALIRNLCAIHNIPLDRAHIARHSDVDSVHKWFCPGEGFPLQRLLDDLAAAPADPADFPLLHAPSISQAAFTAALVAAHSPVLDETDTPILYGICTANSVDPAVALAFFGQETDYGTQDGATDNKNWGNLWDHAAGTIGSYPTWEQGLVDWCTQLQHPPYPSPATVRTIVPIHRGTDRADNDEYTAAVIARIQALMKA
ncbi:MAG: N-acetylmuramoyl-L-alanine amidase [Chloroflexota bacterium]|nr:N-acetylmuramoyl-L-alanine amidase [Chloroflexota bacterium]